MTEYINKTTAYEVLKKMEEEHNLSFSKEAYNKAAITISTMPTEDVQSVKYGKWIAINNSSKKYCSECGVEFKILAYEINDYRFCPYCGAKMDKE